VAVGRSLALAILVLLWPRHIEAQVLATGETLGRGKSALLLSDNILVPGSGIPDLNIAFGEWAKGVSDRLDLYLIGGETTTDGDTQFWVGGGGNLRLARVDKVSVSLFGVASVPFNHRDEACQVLLNPALVASVPLGAKLTVYSGLNALVPIGDRERGVFTPPSTKTNVPVGLTYAIGPWGLWVEGDFGNLNALGLGLTRVW